MDTAAPLEEMMARPGSWRIPLAALALLLAACAPAASAPARRPAAPAAAPASASAGSTAADPALAALVEAARREGSLSFTWGEGTMGGSEGARRLAEGFN